MLSYLAIRNFAIIDELTVEFTDGFLVLTGETGAGKSILVQALHLLLGGRASEEMIRTDQDAAEAEGVFRLPPRSRILGRLEELELAEGDALTIRRIISRSGRNRIFVNGRTASLGALAELSRGLLDISGQHEHVELANEEIHREILDDYGALRPAVEEVARAVRALRLAEGALAKLRELERQRAEREENLRFSLERIRAVAPEPGEDERLAQERLRLRNKEKISGGLGGALNLLYQQDDSAVALLGRARSLLEGIAPVEAAADPLALQLSGVLGQVGDIARELETCLGRLETDPSRLEEVEDRLAALKRLIRSLGPDLPATIERQGQMEAELATLEDLTAQLARAEADRERLSAQALDLARALSRSRQAAAKDLGRKLERELATLAMPGAKVAVEVAALPDEGLNEWGLDQVRLLLSANPGEEVRPLARVASGGELSRVLLALKVVLAGIDWVPTYVFDEVDSGVGGAVAEIIGQKLAAISGKHQVLCITHLPQIAAWATAHYQVAKRVVESRSISEIRRLKESERVDEVARMAGGTTITEQVRKHARELLRRARQP